MGRIIKDKSSISNTSAFIDLVGRIIIYDTAEVFFILWVILLLTSFTLSSKGDQAKWLTKDKQYFIKSSFDHQGVVWKDYLVELLAEEICCQLDIGTIGQQEKDKKGYYGAWSKEKSVVVR